jgi:hypothetical protein
VDLYIHSLIHLHGIKHREKLLPENPIPYMCKLIIYSEQNSAMVRKEYHDTPSPYLRFILGPADLNTEVKKS